MHILETALQRGRGWRAGATAFLFATLFSCAVNAGPDRTAAAGPQHSFLFIVYGDSRSGHDIHRRIVDRIRAEKPDFVLHTGDLVANGFNPEDWDRFFEIAGDLLRDIPFYPTLGNHERNAPAYFKYFVFPNGDGHCYSFDRGSAHFAVIDSNQVGDSTEEKGAFLQRQLEWLREDLRAAAGPMKFVMFHHPLYTVIGRRRSSAAELARKIEPVLVEGDVTAVFSGHDHNYQHHIHDGIHYIVSGGGGAPLYGVSPDSDTAVKSAKVANYVRVRVEHNKAHVEAVDLDGNLLDSFELEGAAGSPFLPTGSLMGPGK